MQSQLAQDLLRTQGLLTFFLFQTLQQLLQASRVNRHERIRLLGPVL